MATDFVKHGIWADYNRSTINKYQILLDDWWAGIITNAIAVLITSVGGPIFILTIKPYNWLWRKISARWTNMQAASLEDAPNLHEQLQIVLEPYSRFQSIHHGGPTASNRRETVEVIGTGVMVLIILGLPVALIVAGIISTGLANDTTAISRSSLCGRYTYQEVNSSGISLEYERRAEAEANLYAIDCYGASPLINSCNRFYNQSISYAASSIGCPFKGNVCDASENGAFKLSTGLISTSILGINSKIPYYIERTMTCSPLVTSDTLVRRGISAQGEEQWEYWYGPSLGDYTWKNPVKKSAWEIKGYSTSVHWSDPTAPRSPYQPLDDFTSGPYPVTLNFISSHSIFYPSFRNDSVFPARTKARFPKGYPGPDLYFNNSTRAGILGCVDRYRIWDSMGTHFWDNSNITSLLELPKAGSEEQYVIWLLLIALKYSTATGSIQFQGSQALDAQAKIAHMMSLSLAENQWQVEAEKMFQTSLARMQLNLHDFVRGTAAKYKGYENTLPAEHRGMCQMVKIPTVGSRNISLVGMIGTVLAVGSVWVISWKCKNRQGDKVLVAVIIGKGLKRGSIWLWNCILAPVLVPSGKAFKVFVIEPLRGMLKDRGK